MNRLVNAIERIVSIMKTKKTTIFSIMALLVIGTITVFNFGCCFSCGIQANPENIKNYNSDNLVSVKM